MLAPLILASASDIRLALLQGAGIAVRAIPARIDEEAIVASLLSENAGPRDIADTLAEMKARKIAERFPSDLVLGCDQVLALGQDLLMKPTSPQHAAEQLQRMQGRAHDLFSALVLYDKAKPIWRHIGVAHLTMHPLTDTAISAYVQAHWASIRHAVGCYKIEEAGRSLFSAVDGHITTIQGLPLAPLLAYLQLRGAPS